MLKDGEISLAKILCRFGFCELLRIKNDRGVGVDTVYYAKPAENKALATL